ncbi:MAG: hypothetical protein C0596_05395 [Marinilabiliales bacterium]|nr:MAG: hypothetical protein C0596_05395 [Marinilabiliales bacterium]
MANICPRCGGPVKRGYNKTAWRVGGLVALLFIAAFGSFQCEKCGKISQSEFPPDVKHRNNIMSVLMIIGAIALIVLVIYIFSL